jgi:hypothetical protein
MRDISDAFLLNMAEVSASLVGLFLVGIFVFLETGLLRGGPGAAQRPYIRSSAQIVIVAYGMCIGLSVSLVALDLIWSRVLLIVLSVLLVAANVESARGVRRIPRTAASPALITTEILGTIATILGVTLPWILGGLEPSREDLTWSILVSFAIGFVSIWAMVLTAFEISAPTPEVAATQPASKPPAKLAPQRPSARRRANAAADDDPPPSDG